MPYEDDDGNALIGLGWAAMCMLAGALIAVVIWRAMR